MTFTRIGALANADIDTIEDVATIEINGMKILWIEFAIATAALTAFAIDFKLREAGNWITVASIAGDFTGPVHPVIKASGSLVTAGVGNHWAKIDVTGVQKVRLRAAGTSSALLGSFSLG